MKTGAAGEQAVAVRDVDHIVLGAAGSHDGPSTAVLPQVDVVLGIEGHHPPAGGAGGGLDAHALAQRRAQQTVGIGFPQITFADKRQFMQIFHTVDVARGDPFLLHLGAVVGDVVVDVVHLGHQTLALQGAQLVLGHGFNFGLIHGHENQSLLIKCVVRRKTIIKL